MKGAVPAGPTNLSSAMAKRRRHTRERELDRELDRAMKGLEPWSYADLVDVLLHFEGLGAGTQDEWDLRRHGVTIQLGDEVERFEFNMLDVDNQMVFWFRERYGIPKFVYPAVRWIRIRGFLANKRSIMIKLGLMRPAPDKGTEIDEALLEALCQVPFDRVDEDKDKRDFSLDTVLESTRKLKAAKGEEPPF